MSFLKSASPAETDLHDGTSGTSSDSTVPPTSMVPDGHKSPNRSRWWLFNILIPIAIVAAGAGALLALGKVESPQRPPDDASYSGRMRALMQVRTEQIKSLSDFGQRLEMSVDGTVVPFREVRIATEIAGRIIEKSPKCEAGSFVKQGELLMKIDPTDYELEVERLTRMKEQEYKALGEVDQDMVNTKRLIEVAMQDETLQQREVDRLLALPSGFASEGEIDKARRAALQARQQVVSYENQLDLLKKRRLRLEASERLADAQLNTANVNLERSEIRSPIDGVIVNEDAELNTFVARGSTVVTIEDTTKVEVATSLRMDQLYWVLDQIDRNDPVSITEGRGYDIPETPAIVEFEISGREGKTYRWNGRLLSYNGIGLDPATRTVPVRILVNDPSAFETTGGSKSVSGPTTLVRGMYVTVKLLIDPKTPLSVIPAEGLKPGNRVWHFIPDDSVLLSNADGGEESKKSSDASAAVQTPAADAAISTEPKLSRFDPDDWIPGRIVSRDSIFPVDSLSVSSVASKADRDNPLHNKDRRWWVCEIQNQTMTPGAFVVVSPVGTIADSTAPARMLKPGVSEPMSSDTSALDASASDTATLEAAPALTGEAAK